MVDDSIAGPRYNSLDITLALALAFLAAVDAGRHRVAPSVISISGRTEMVVRSWHVGDVIRKLREQHALTATSLARKAGLQRSVVLSLERQGPEIEGITPSQWRALDRVAAALGLANGASLYKQIPNAVDLTSGTAVDTDGNAAPRVLRFTKK